MEPSTPSVQIFYPTNYTVRYTNDTEYREAIRHVFRMTCNILAVPGEGEEEVGDGIDSVTQDEWNFDAESTGPFLNFVFHSTEYHPIFQELYTLAAGLMLSQDPDIGLAVLFSYDYFELFHVVLCEYFKFIENDDPFEGESLVVAELRRRLTRR